MENFSDQQISAYFLGKMPTLEAEKFEMKCAVDAEFNDHAQLIERELIDDYLRGNLSDDDAHCFETNYLTTEARRDRLRVAKNLWQIAAEQPQAVAVTTVSFWQNLFGKNNALRLAAACAVLLVVGAFAFYLLSLNVNRTDVAEVKEPVQTAKIETPPVENPDDAPALNSGKQNENRVTEVPLTAASEPEKTPVAQPKNQPESKPVAPKNNLPIRPTMTMVVKLMPGSLRAEGEQSINIAPNAKALNFLLSPAGNPNNYKTYRAVVKNAEGATVFTTANLNSLSFRIPSEKLENRTYVVFLEGQNAAREFESIAEYTFRVRR